MSKHISFAIAPQPVDFAFEQEPEYDFSENIQQIFQPQIDDPLQADIEQLNYLILDKQFSLANCLKEQILQKYSAKELYKYQQTFDYLDQDYQEMQDLVKWFDLKEGWQVQQSNKKMQVRYQQLPHSPRIVARIDTEISIPLDVFVSLIYESDLYSEWFPFCKEALTIKQPDKATKIIKLHSNPPIISDRELCVKGWGVNDLEYDGSIYVLSHSIDKKKNVLDRYNVQFPLEGQYVRSDLIVFCTKIVPQSYDHHIVSLVVCIDLKLKYIPDYIPNFMLRKFSGLIFERLLLNSKNYKGSKWEKKKQEGSEFYLWLDQKFLEYKPRLSKTINKK